MYRLATYLLITSAPFYAWASPECASISDDASRLSCYDDIYLNVSQEEGDPVSSAFTRFAELAEYEGERGWRQMQLDECVLYDHVLIYPLYQGQVVYSVASLWQLRVDLSVVDSEKLTMTNNGSQSIVLERGYDLIYSEREFVNYSSYAGDLNFVQPEPVPRQDWDSAIFSNSYIVELYPNEGDNSAERLTPRNERSVEWRFSSFWPEDVAEIHDAFVSLVDACD